MKKFIFIALALLPIAACNQNKQEEKSVIQSSNNNALSSLTKEQQEAVRILVRDTLISDPKILADASESYQALQMREKNEAIASNFTKISNNNAKLSFGPSNAKVTIIEYFDYRCGYCHAAAPYIKELMDKNKDYRFIFKELPILSDNSVIATKAAYAAHNQGKYIALHRALMSAGGDLDLTQILQIAQGVGIDVTKLQADMNKPEVSEYIENIRNEAQELGISGTPGFVINGKLISGYAKEEIDSLIAQASKS